MDMANDIFAQTPFGKIALEKIKPTSPNFRLYSAGWLETGGPPETWEVMEVTGAEFRAAKSGLYKGTLCIKIKGTERTAHVTKAELQARPKTKQ